MSETIKCIAPDHGLTQCFMGVLASFAHARNWKERQTYATLCSELLVNSSLSNEQFATEVLPHFIDLSWDPVANVRLVVAQIIAKRIVTSGKREK